MKLTVCPLFSGSSGNSILISTEKTRVLLDAGVSASRLSAELLKIGAAPSEISALLISHEHSDHIQGAGIFSRKYDIPVYATAGTWQAGGEKLGEMTIRNTRLVEPGMDFFLGDLTVLPFSLSHDAAEPVGYVFLAGGASVAVATDLGCVRDSWVSACGGCQIVMLESNYDPDMLVAGRYPYALKKRIMGSKGHLSNDDAARAAVRLAGSGVRQIILSHLSKENNFPELAGACAQNALVEAGFEPGRNIGLTVARRDGNSGIYTVEA